MKMSIMRIGRAELRVLDLEESIQLLYKYNWFRISRKK